jgi:hypothetical protein
MATHQRVHAQVNRIVGGAGEPMARRIDVERERLADRLDPSRERAERHRIFARHRRRRRSRQRQRRPS